MLGLPQTRTSSLVNKPYVSNLYDLFLQDNPNMDVDKDRQYRFSPAESGAFIFGPLSRYASNLKMPIGFKKTTAEDLKSVEDFADRILKDKGLFRDLSNDLFENLLLTPGPPSDAFKENFVKPLLQDMRLDDNIKKEFNTFIAKQNTKKGNV